MARATIPPTTPPAIAPLLEEDEEAADESELCEGEEERLGVVVALKKSWTAGSSNFVLLPLHQPSAVLVNRRFHVLTSRHTSP